MQDDHNDGDEEQDVDESTGNAENKSTGPKKQENDGYDEEHEVESRLVRFTVAAPPPLPRLTPEVIQSRSNLIAIS
jgi:hypothetical protein